MGYTDPPTFVASEKVTVAEMNILSDDIRDLNTRTTPDTDYVAATETTTSTSYTNLTTPGPAATVTVGATGRCLVTVTAQFSNNGTNTSYMAFAISGASTVAANDINSLDYTSPTANFGGRWSATYLIEGLTPGSTTFTAKYRVSAGTGSWQNRNIVAIPIA